MTEEMNRDFVIAPPPVAAVALEGASGRFPIHRIYCVGRNYAEHAREMGKDPTREAPFFFLKPADAIVPNESVIHYPLATKNFHHEIELVVAIRKGGVNIATADALDHVFGYAVGIDLTRRDLQLEARDKGRPWDSGKAFDLSAPSSALRPASIMGHPKRGGIWLKVNGIERQRADISDLIWSVPEIIAHLSALFCLMPGDLIYTGTPAGVGPLKPGDSVRGGIDGIGEIGITVAP